MFFINIDKMNLQSSENQLKNDKELTRKICKGDSTAFEKLFYQYCQNLINFAYRFAKDTQIAENIVQDVFLKIWQNREQLEPSKNIKIYLYTAVKNRALKLQRHIEVERHYTENINGTNFSTPTPEDKKIQNEIEESICQAITQLPEKAGIIFSMNRFDNLTYKEIAKIQNISIKTVETQMGRALKFLRNQLSHLISLL